MICNYKNEVIDGEYKEYNINEKIIEICNYKNGEKNIFAINKN